MTIEKDKLLKLAIDTANEMGIKVIDNNDGKHYIGNKELTKEMIKEMIWGEGINKNEYVYCTNCKCGKKLINAILNNADIPEQCYKCYPYNPEDSFPYKNRPCYKPNYQLNKKAIYVSGY